MSQFRVYALVNMMGSKGECAVNDGTYSFSLTRGRGTANDVHVVCYGLADRPQGIVADPLKANSMKSNNHNSGFHKEEYAVCLDTSSQNPVRNGGGMLIVNRLKLGGG